MNFEAKRWPEAHRREQIALELAQAVALFAGRWRLRILFQLCSGRARRFNTLERSIGISQKVLTQQLRSLERDGLVKRTVFPEVPARVEYSLTDWAEALRPSLEALWVWRRERQNSAAPGSPQGRQ